MAGCRLLLVLNVYLFHAHVNGQCFYTGICYTKHDKGESYRGITAVTKSGKSCIPWNRHLHMYATDKYPYDGLERNYCRNPKGSGHDAPWCYKTPTGKEEESWEYCAVELCDKCLFRGVQLKFGDRFHDGCSLCICQQNGIKCLECEGGPKFTNQMGCYVKYRNEDTFPRCCPRVVCHGKDSDFNLTEYFNYLKYVLRAHVTQTAVIPSVTNATEPTVHVLP